MPKRANFSPLTPIAQAVQRVNRWMQGISHKEFLDDELRRSAIMLKLSVKRQAD
jgi:uncharacterized protein with HEPN domain